MRAFRHTVKAGEHAGAEYWVVKRICYDVAYVSIDPELTGWHRTPKAARLAAEDAGYTWNQTAKGWQLQFRRRRAATRQAEGANQ